jgi:membrane fusion protein, multidrug efflux system
MKRSVVVGVLLLTLLGAGYAARDRVPFLSGKDTSKTAPALPPILVSAHTVQTEDVPRTVRLSGMAVAYETVTIRSRVDSQVQDVAFHDGDQVKEGQLLFLLDDRSLKAKLAQEQANLAKADAQLLNAQKQLERYSQLAEKDFASREKMEDVKATFETQKAAVTASKAAVLDLQTQLGYTKITAPIAGRAGTIAVTRGNTVKANDTSGLVTINQITPLRVQFAIPQRYFGDVQAARQAGRVVVGASQPDQQTGSEGVLESIDNTIDTATGTFMGRAVFENADERLWPGMYLNVRLVLSVDTQVLTVPVEALQGKEGAEFVYVLADGDIAKKTPVQLRRIEGRVAVIGDGIKAGDSVVTNGLLRLSDGAKVAVAAPGN